MRRERRQRPVLRGLLLFVLGALVGANATYFVMTRDAGPRTAMPAGERIETPLPMQPATEADASANNSNPASPSTGPMLPPPAVRATGVGPTAVPASGDAATMTGEGLLLPVQGIVEQAFQCAGYLPALNAQVLLTLPELPGPAPYITEHLPVHTAYKGFAEYLCRPERTLQGPEHGLLDVLLFKLVQLGMRLYARNT